MADESPSQQPGETKGTDDERPGFIKTWLIAIRPFALPASTMPIVFGTALAVWHGASFRPLLALMALVAMVCLHSGSNLLNDIGDFRRGVDRVPSPVSGAVVRGLLSTRQAFVGAALFLAVGVSLGLAIVALVGLPILYLGLVGVAIGVSYTLGPAPLKYHALGDLAVCLAFGVLGSLGAWTVQTGSLSLVPAVWAVPIGMLIAGIVHANNWRDIPTDSEARIVTVASILGDRGSLGYYGFLLFGAFAYIVAVVAVTNLAGLRPAMPLTFFVVLLALPRALGLLRRARERRAPKTPLDFAALDGATAQLNLVFGLLCVGALGLDAALGRLF
jgi:1,4-dihydroxy-2-naphthoate octaprenyltransferase